MLFDFHEHPMALSNVVVVVVAAAAVVDLAGGELDLVVASLGRLRSDQPTAWHGDCCPKAAHFRRWYGVHLGLVEIVLDCCHRPSIDVVDDVAAAVASSI